MEENETLLPTQTNGITLCTFLISRRQCDPTSHNWIGHQHIIMVDFIIVDYPSLYNGILRKLFLIRAVASTYHLTLKFLAYTKTRVVVLRNTK